VKEDTPVPRHTVEITENHQAVLEDPLERTALISRRRLVQLAPGAVIRGEVRSYVEDWGRNCLVEVADITLPEGGTLLGVPCCAFRFIDN
jgi:hypothetical protein